MKKIAIIGAGNLGTAIIEGLVKNRAFKPENIIATRKTLNRVEDLRQLGVKVTDDNKLAVREVDYVLVSLEPSITCKILGELKEEFSPEKILISVAKGLTLNVYEQVLPHTKIFRVMINTAVAVEESMTSICANTQDEKTIKEVESIFNKIGETVTLDESMMNAATVIGASGIAYSLRFLRAMIQGAIEIGFNPETATKIVTQTAKGATQLIIENKLHPEQEIDKVTTPSGCTIAGLNEMEHQGFSSAIIQGIKTSYEKS